MTSTGTIAVFVHPTDALHGGLGVVACGDVVIALSNSGETKDPGHSPDSQTTRHCDDRNSRKY